MFIKAGQPDRPMTDSSVVGPGSTGTNGSESNQGSNARPLEDLSTSANCGGSDSAICSTPGIDLGASGESTQGPMLVTAAPDRPLALQTISSSHPILRLDTSQLHTAFAEISTLPSPFPSAANTPVLPSSNAIFRSYNGSGPPVVPGELSGNHHVHNASVLVRPEAKAGTVPGTAPASSALATLNAGPDASITAAALPNMSANATLAAVKRLPRGLGSVESLTRIRSVSEYVPRKLVSDLGSGSESVQARVSVARHASGGHRAPPTASSFTREQRGSVSSESALSSDADALSEASTSPPVTSPEDNSMGDYDYKESENVPRVYEAYDQNNCKSTWLQVRKLGHGAFSQVVVARPYLGGGSNPGSEQDLVAIKLVDFGADVAGTRGLRRDDKRQRLQRGLMREIEIIKSVSHPSLICMYAFNMDSRGALMVLPYCPGGDLFELAAKHRAQLTPELLGRIFAETAQAIRYLHQHNIVHRDIKLENVLLNRPLNELLAIDNLSTHNRALVTVIDLGLSRTIDPNDPLLTTRCGSEDYIPPELLMGQPYDGRQSDAWALGVLLYALLEGRLPFDLPQPTSGGRVLGKVSHRIARVEWAWLNLLHEGQNGPYGGAKEIVQHCLQKRDGRWTVAQIVNHHWAQKSLAVELVPPHASDAQRIRDLFTN